MSLQPSASRQEIWAFVPHDWYDGHARALYQLQLVDVIKQRLGHEGWHMVLHPLPEDDTVTDLQHIQRTLDSAGHLPACLLITRLQGKDTPLLRHLRVRGMPFVVYGHDNETDDYPWVDVDNAQAMSLAVDELVALGHRHIAFVNGPLSFSYARQREQGYRDAMARHQLHIPTDWVLHVDPTVSMGALAGSYLFTNKQCPTAVLCATDDLAVGAMQAIGSLGYGVGRQVSVVGYGGTQLSQAFEGGLASVTYDKTEVAHALADQLLAAVTGGSATMRVPTLVPTRWQAGASAQAPLVQLLGPQSPERKVSPPTAYSAVAYQQLLREKMAMERAQSLMHMGSWYFDAEHNQFHGSAPLCSMLGFAPGKPFSWNAVFALVPENDRLALTKHWALATRGQPMSRVVNMRLLGADLKVHWFANFARDSQGKVIWGEGLLHITDPGDWLRPG